MGYLNRLFFVFFILLWASCSSYQEIYPDIPINKLELKDSKVPLKRLYLIGDAGKTSTTTNNPVLDAFTKLISTRETQNDLLLYLGDNVYENGFHPEEHPKRNADEAIIQAQINAAKMFKGRTVFIPGNHDWYSGLSGLKAQEKFIENQLGKNSFLPENGCPIETEELADEVVMIYLDTQWFITDWDKHAEMNDDCTIKTRDGFFEELDSKLKKHYGKTIVIAMHHPAYTYGQHGGRFHASKHLFPFENQIPLPILGSLAVQLRSQGGVSNQDRYSKMYRMVMDRIITLAKDSERLIFVSGHEHNLQYIDYDGIKQIVSGSGSKESIPSIGNGTQFFSSGLGFAVLDIFDDGTSTVKFYDGSEGEPKLLFETEIYNNESEPIDYNFPSTFKDTISSSIYDPADTQKTSSYKKFWGTFYRDTYGIKFQVPVATLDTLLGGVKIDRKGGGHQTRSLRLIDPNGKNFALRAMKKSAVQYLQSVAFTDQYIQDDFRGTYTEDFIMDFYTASHPFAALAIAPMSDAIGLYHTNPKIYYMPKHEALGAFNSEFGDELYVLEERPDDGFLDTPSFGNPDAIESTEDVYKNLRKDEKYRIDEASLIRARLFDMVIGDWDRHQDQWRWSRFDVSDNERLYRPIPRDRDQAFSKYDGTILEMLKIIMPPARQLQKFDGDFKEITWLNQAGIKLDRAFIQTSNKELWVQEARYIAEQLTDDVIEAAFAKLPVELQNETIAVIKEKLRSRRDLLVDAATRYYDYMSKLVVITGTDKDDRFEIIRQDDATLINVYRIYSDVPKSESKPYKSRLIRSNETNEVWIYGLDDDDRFEVTGTGSNPVFIRIIGGQNNDSYDIQNGAKIKVFDHKSKPNTYINTEGASVRRTDNYNFNTYNPRKMIQKVNQIVPAIGFNPDDGLKIGVMNKLTISGFKSEPFHHQHIFKAGYFFATQGFGFNYQGTFADVIGHWNLIAEGTFTSENFTQNFFGYGNETENTDDFTGTDYNRVRTGILSGGIGISKDGQNGSTIAIQGKVEQVEVENSKDRFISEFYEENDLDFEADRFAKLLVTYKFKGGDGKVVPTRGMNFSMLAGVTTNLSDTDRTFSFLNPSVSFYNALSDDHKWVLKTMAQGKFIFGDTYEFFQAATLGGDTGLRGYRFQRFSGTSSVAFGGDIRYHFEKMKTVVLPLQFGVLAGADTGRVWLKDEDSSKWHSDFGMGFWVNAVDTIAGEFSLFGGNEGLRFSFLLGISF